MGSAISTMDMSSRPLALVEYEDRYQNKNPVQNETPVQNQNPHKYKNPRADKSRSHSAGVARQRELFPISESCYDLWESDSDEQKGEQQKGNFNDDNTSNSEEEQNTSRCGGGGGDDDCVRVRDNDSRTEIAGMNTIEDVSTPTTTSSKSKAKSKSNQQFAYQSPGRDGSDGGVAVSVAERNPNSEDLKTPCFYNTPSLIITDETLSHH